MFHAHPLSASINNSIAVIDTVIIGTVTELVGELIKLNKWGEVPITPACETELPGLYAAGDVTSVPEKQIIVAAGEGSKAALQAHRYLQRLGK